MHRNLECEVHELRQIGSGQTGDGRHSRNVDILGIMGLEWTGKGTGMGEFNSDDHYIYYCGQEFLIRNGVAIIVNKSPKCSTWMQSQKRQNDLCSFPRQTIQYHRIQIYALSKNAEEAEVEQLYEDLQDLLELTP